MRVKLAGGLLGWTIVLWIALFYLPGVQAQSRAVLQTGPTLQISTAVTATFGSVITVPLSYAGAGYAVSATAFSLDIDQTCLTLDTGDQNNDGRPDGITFHTPPGLNAFVTVDLTDTDGELDIIIADFSPPFVILPDLTPLLTLRLSAACQPEPGTTRSGAILFAQDPTPSFGTATGGSVPGTAIDGVVTIIGPAVVATATPTPTLTPTPEDTPTLVATAPTATPTLIPTALPTLPPMTLIDTFVATPVGATVRLTWHTSSEANTAGFYLYRKQIDGQGNSGDFQPITPLLPGQGAQGGDYIFVDQTVQANSRYVYLLVEEKQSGARTEFIQLLRTVRLTDPQPYQSLLPFIMR